MKTSAFALVLLCAASASGVSIVGRQTSPTQWTYDLTFASRDNFSVNQPTTSITIAGLCGVTAAGKPTSTDFPPALDEANRNWTAEVVNSTTVRWTITGSGTGNFGDEKHINGFTVTAAGAINGTGTLVTDGMSFDSPSGPDLDITTPVLGPVCTAAGKPTVTAALNSASYALPGSANGGLAQGSLVTVFGSGLGPATLVAGSYPLLTTLGGTSVKVTMNNVGYDALMVYSSAGQAAVVLPSTVPAGLGSLQLTYSGQASAAIPVQVVETAFGAYTFNQSGSGQAIVQNVVSATELPVNTTANSARPGQIAILWGTGLGKVTGNEALGPLAGDLTVPTTLRVGNAQAQILYRGRSGCCPGVDQINFVVPNGSLGCAVPVVVTTGTNVVSNSTTMAVAANGGACTPSASEPARTAGLELRRE